MMSSDPDEDPAALLFYSAQIGSIAGMEKAIEKDPKIIYASETFEGMSALHLAAGSSNPVAVHAVQWLLEKGIPWSAVDKENRTPEDVARIYKNEESCKILKEWAIEKGGVSPGDLCHSNQFTLMFMRAQNMNGTIKEAWARIIQTKANPSPWDAWIWINGTTSSASPPSFLPTPQKAPMMRSHWSPCQMAMA